VKARHVRDRFHGFVRGFLFRQRRVVGLDRHLRGELRVVVTPRACVGRVDRAGRAEVIPAYTELNDCETISLYMDNRGADCPLRA
jgi:hypothetical protein